jgi:hypothetical protein
MATTESLIVPIDVAALCVGQDDVNGSDAIRYGTIDFARVASDFSTLPYLDRDGNAVRQGPNLADLALPQPFMKASDPLEQGIHLHWALPDALSHGVTDREGTIDFREAPNRWLVVRIVSGHEDPASPACAVKGWVIESDYLQEETDHGELAESNASSRDIPLQPNYDPDALPNKAYRKIGRIFAYDEWSERRDGAYLSATTAVGYGIPLYAAAYDHCRNVFGLHDTLDDLDLSAFKPGSTRISYLVAGWFSDSRRDPLSHSDAPTGASYREKLADLQRTLRWTFASDETRSFPTATLCSGLLCDIIWDPANTRYIEPRPETPIDVAIGNTTIEALSALIAHDPALEGFRGVERFMNALQLGMLQHLGEPDGTARFEEAMHGRGFGSADGGEIWTIKRNDPKSPGEERGGVITGEHLLDAASAMGDALPPSIAHDLNDLNIAQQSCDAAGSAIDSRRRQIFADWYKYMVRAYPPTMMEEGTLGHLLAAPSTVGDIDVGDITDFIGSEIEDLNGAISELDGLRAVLDAKRLALEKKLGERYRLMRLGAPRYWQANDPVFLLSGRDVMPSRRYAGDVGCDAKGNLICRLSSAIISMMAVNDGAFAARADDLPHLPASIGGLHAGLPAALFGETFFLDPNQAWLLAWAIAKRGGSGNPAMADRDAFVRRVREAQRSMRAGQATEGIAFTGIAPTEAGLQEWRAPWVPLLLQWEAYYYPAKPISGAGGSRDYPVDVITGSYRLDGSDTDLVPRAPAPPDRSSRTLHQGSALLTHNTEINIKAQIDAYLRNFPDDPNAAALKAIRDRINIAAMAQSLDGLGSAMLMRRATLQLPVFDPLGPAHGPMQNDFSNRLVRDAVGSMNDMAPVPLGSYSPLRAGHLEIARVRIIDAFGQVREIEKPNLIRAESLLSSTDGSVLLPPRLVQPSRLSFRWLSATDDLVEMNSEPASSPIFGWLLFNHLDTSLMIYDAAGDPLGSLNARGDLWRGAPGNDATYGQPPEKALAGANPHLRNFVLGIHHNLRGRDFLVDLLGTIDRAAGAIIPSGYRHDHALSLLIGRPLALVRASLDLELQGLPALDMSWDAFREAMPKSAYGERRSGGVAKVKFPVRVGGSGTIDDGLVGYFIDDETEGAYRTCYAPTAREGSDTGVVRPASRPIVVDAESSARPTILSMIVDPRAPVHAATGILPMKEIAIPPHIYGDSLNRMAVTFLTTPLLTGIGAPSIPLPREEGYAWSWVTHNTSAPGWSTTDDISPVNARGNFASLPQRISEGWLKLSRTPSPEPPSDI